VNDRATRGLVLYAGCLPAVPFRQFVGAAASAGFAGVTMWPLMYRRALSREDLTPLEMRAVADDAGIAVTCVEGCGDWLPLNEAGPKANIFRVEWTRHDFFRTALELGADTVVASDMTGGQFSHQQAVDGFGQLCTDAASHGLKVALEFIGFSEIKDLGSAWAILRDSNAANASLVFDVCHFRRGGSTLQQLTEVPALLITDVQLGDGTAEAPEDLLNEAMYGRTLPGTGDFAVADLLAALAARGVSANSGPEVYLPEGTDAPFATAATLMEATRRVLAPEDLR
jgi:4-hydroxyphenylpyruvate dioxygenase